MTTPRPLPTWLRDAVSATPTPHIEDSHTGTFSQTPDPAAGQIRRLDPMDPDGTPSRLILIVGTDPGSAAAQVVLLSNEVDMGTDTDNTLATTTTGLAYDVVALTDVTGPAWYVQLGPVLATVDLSCLSPTARHTTGTPVNGPTDARWAWKQSEHDSLLALIGECARQVIDESPDSVVDPAALDVAVVSDVELALMVHATAPLLNDGKVCVPASALRTLIAAQVTPRSSYWDAVRCLLDLMPRHGDLVVYDTSNDLALAPRADIPNDFLSTVLSAALQRQPESHRSLCLLTLPSLWNGIALTPTHDSRPDAPPIRQAASGVWELHVDGRRHQLVVHTVDLPESNETPTYHSRGVIHV